jgi:tripartite-type tricarboxylate transporter receptor subunit TctC
MSAVRVLAATFFAALIAAPAAAQTFPSKTMRLVVPFAPGGNLSITARLIAPELATILGQQMIVDNRPGASGQIGAELVAKSPPDGHTLMMASSSVMSNVPAVYPKLTYDILKDFVPVGQVTEVPMVIVVHPSVPAHNTRQFIALAKANPGQLRMASGGIGTTSHLIAELFHMTAGVNMLIVPYKGAGPAVTDLLGGHIDSRIDQIPSSMPHIQSKRLRAIAVTSARRTSQLPDVPTVAESALPGFESSSVSGVLAPAGTPPAVVQRLNAALVQALSNPTLVRNFAELGAEARPSSSEALGKFIREDLARWRMVVKKAGIKPE